MNPEQFKTEQVNHGFTNPEMACMCGVSVRTVERWRKGTVNIPGSVKRLLEVYAILRNDFHRGVMNRMIQTFNKEVGHTG